MKFKSIFSVAFTVVMCCFLFSGVVFLNNWFSDSSTSKSNSKNHNNPGSIKTDKSNETENDTVSSTLDSDNGNLQTEINDRVIGFLAAGDNIVHQSVMDDAKSLAIEYSKETDYYFDSMYENLQPIISSADIAFINQEGPIGGKELNGYTGYPAFNAPNEAGTALVNIGFDIINIANNHMLDRGEKGYANSIAFWKNQPVTLIGGYESEEDFNNIRYLDYNGVKIALLSYTYGTNGYYLPSNSTMWVPYYNENNILQKHATEARKNSDIVIVSMHWGDENSFTPNRIQKQYCDILVNCNVDVIIGTHPHVLQPIEWKERPDGKKTLVAYSIGNLLSTMEYSKNLIGGLLTFEINYTDSTDIYIQNPILIPTICFYSKNRNGLKLYEFSKFSKEMYELHGCTLKENVSFEQAKKYITDTIAKEFLPDDF